MLITTPDRKEGEPEALIPEARERQRRRHARVAAAILAAAGGALILWNLFGSGSSNGAVDAGGPKAALASSRCPGTDLGEVAYVRGGALDVVDFARCVPTTLVAKGVSGTPAFSADGTYVSFAGGYVAASGGAVHRVPSTQQLSWSPARTMLAYATKAGALDLLIPGLPPRRLVAASWGAGTPMFSPNGKTIVFTVREGLATVPVTGGKPRLLARVPAIPLGFSPDGRYFLFHESTSSASLAADGMTLVLVDLTTGRHKPIARTLGRSDFATWCGDRLAYVIDEAGRSVTMGDGVALIGPPWIVTQWVLPTGGATSWNALACSADGVLAVSAGPSSNDSPFGKEHRSLWLLPTRSQQKPRLLTKTTPPGRLTDELPMWSADGKYLAFVRTTPSGISGKGQLYAYDVARKETIGPIASVGRTGNYYGSYSWANQIAWHR